MTDFCKGVCVDLWKEAARLQAENERLRKENERLYGILEPFACDCETHCEEFSYGCDSWLAQKAFDVKRENEK